MYIHSTSLLLFFFVQSTLQQSGFVVFLPLGGCSFEDNAIFLFYFHFSIFIIFKNEHDLIISSLV